MKTVIQKKGIKEEKLNNKINMGGFMERGTKRKQATLLFVIAMLVTFCLGVGLSYAYFSDSKSASNTLSFGKLKVTVNSATMGTISVSGIASEGQNGLLAKGDKIVFKGGVGLEAGSVNAYVRLKFDNFKYYTAGTTTEITDMNEGYKNVLSKSILAEVAEQTKSKDGTSQSWTYKESGGYQYLYYGKAMKAGEANLYDFNQDIKITEDFIPTAFEGVELQFDIVVEAIQTTGAVDESGVSVSIEDPETATAKNAEKISTITMWNVVFPSQIEKDSVPKLTFTADDTAKTVEVSGVEDGNNVGEIAIPKYVKKNGSTYEWTNETSGDNLYKVTSIKVESEMSFGAFQNCSSLTSITIPSSVTSIGEYAFDHCTSLTSIEFDTDSQLESIGNQAFVNCTSLTSITIPDRVISIGQLAFQNCSSLTSITIPSSVTSIESGAFLDCTSLKTFTIESGTIASCLTSQDACGYLVYYATTIKIKSGLTVGSYLTDGVTAGSWTMTAEEGYNVYTKAN